MDFAGKLSVVMGVTTFLLCSVASVATGEEIIGEDLLPPAPPTARNPKLLMNLAGIFGEPVCNDNGTPIGVCKNELSCLKEKGLPALSYHCDFIYGKCCQYTRECGGSSGQRVVYWQSHGYPDYSTVAGTCRFDLNPGTDICYVKVEVLEANIVSQKKSECMANTFFIYNQNEGNGSPFCSALSGYEMYVKVKYESTLTLSAFGVPIKFFVNMKSTPYRFRMRMTQIKCSDIGSFPGTGGGRRKREAEALVFPSTRRGRRLNAVNTPEEATFPNSGGVAATQAEGRQRKCPNPKIVLPPFGTPLHFAFQYRSVFSDLIEERLNFVGLVPPTRIAPANTVSVSDYPWLGFVLLQNGPDSPQFCGAVLVSSKYALTAAHCLVRAGEFDPYVIKVTFGRTVIDTTLSPMITDSSAVSVSRVVLHPMFDFTTLHYDFALLELEAAVSYTPINLPDAGKSYAGETGLLLGWGLTSAGGSLPTQPSSLQVTIISNDECNTKWNNNAKDYSYGDTYIQDEMVCADSASGSGICAGDSGGPLVVEEGGSYTLVGIISGAYFTCTSSGTIGEFPDIATRVSSFRDFLDVATAHKF